jgi:dissimilatory sulfite reductase (desulfoviridin) alpha/beta subunit
MKNKCEFCKKQAEYCTFYPLKVEERFCVFCRGCMDNARKKKWQYIKEHKGVPIEHLPLLIHKLED